MSDIDLNALREAITDAEHKPGDWARAPNEMGGICSDYEMAALMVHDAAPPKSWGHFGFKRDSWLAIAAVNSLPAMLDRLESAERRAEEAEKECAEQARLVGMGAERELALMAKLGQAEKERDAQKEISRGLVGYMEMIEGTLGMPGDYPLSDLLVHIDELRNDAERYRWICDGHGYFMEEEYLCGHENEKSAADAAIDKRMAKEGGK